MPQPASDYDPRKLPVETYVPPAPPSMEIDQTVDLREMVRILLRRKVFVLGAVAAVVGAAALYVSMAPRVYTATATIMVDPQRSQIADAGENRAPATRFGSDDAVVESQVLLVNSPAVLRRVVESLKLGSLPDFQSHVGVLGRIRNFLGMGASASPPSKDAAETALVEALQERLKVAREGTTFVIDIDASSRDPQTASKIANAVAESYLYEQVNSRRETNKRAADWLNQQLGTLKARVKASDKAVENFRTSHNLVTTQGVTVNDQQLTDLNNRLVEAHVQTAEARAKYQQVEGILKRHKDPGTLDKALSSQVIRQLRTQYAQIAQKVADLSSKFGPQHPKVVDAKAQLRATGRLIHQELTRILDSTKEAYRVAQSREQALRNSLDKLQNASTTTSQAQVRLRELQREADANRLLYESFLSRYKATAAQESLDLPDSRIVSQADVPIRPSSPKVRLILALAGLLGGGLGVVLAFGVDFLDRRIKSPRQAETITGLPTLGAVPLVGTRELARRANRGRLALDQYDPQAGGLLPGVMQPPLMRYALEEPTSLFAEAVRAVRLAVQRVERQAPAKVVMVASSIDGEGKTTLAINLALSLAAVGKRTIIVDGDLRNPELSRSLCPQAKSGLIDVALGRAPLSETLLIDRSMGFSILPSPPGHNGRLINEFVFSGAMRNLLAHLRNHFDYVVVDSPPLIPLVDGRALAEQADRIILAVRWDYTPQDVVAQAIETVAPVGDRLLGTVLTRVDMRRLRYYDYYRSSSYIQPYSYLGQPRAETAP